MPHVRCRIFLTPVALCAPSFNGTRPSLQINVTNWNKEFNDRTGPFEQGIPVPTRTYVNEDKTHRLVLYHPPLSILVKKAAGITRGAMEPLTETVGLISLKHVYHIAEMKRQVVRPQDRFPLHKAHKANDASSCLME